jgi:hypothetical protein
MKNRLRSHIRPVLASALVAVMLGSVGVAVAGQASEAEEPVAHQAKKKHRNQGERGPRGKRGRRGPRGPRGAQGAQGPQGAPGVGVQFGVALPTDVSPTVVFNQSGVKIEAGCSSGSVSLTARATSGDHNVIQVTSFDNLEAGKPRSESKPDWPINLPVNMLAGGSGLHDYNGIVGVRSFGGEVVTIQWFAMGSAFTSQGDCVVGGTASP